MTTSEIRFGMVRKSWDEFRYSEWHPILSHRRLTGMETQEETKQKGSEQPPTKVGYDDQRSKTGEKKGDSNKGSPMTDKVMEEQSRHHQVQRT